ncbi:MAG TPA: LysM peptidoglycan-binding domain-containing protein [Polyangiales bacterium]|nr:LysM peptidoglycan-binding domain-containing protein [Polyangiales bacterium]
MLAEGRHTKSGGTLLGVLAVCCGLAWTPNARADRQHTVKPGQSLAQIAKLYRVGADDLAAANGMGRADSLRGGQVLKVPPEGVVFVAKGQTLGGIARAHGVSEDALAKANKLDLHASLQIGQRLTLPGAKPTKTEQRSGKPKRAGVVSFYRIWSRETIRVTLLDDKGNVRPGALRQMREFMRPRESRKRKLPNERLMRLLAQVSDHFGGRPLHVVSGYRLPGGFTRDTSRHVAGEAMDFRIPGVPLEELRDHCQRFDHVGVGFYPRTQFVHLDVRVQNARWTDWSLPGQAPVLQKPDDVDDKGNAIEAEPIMPATEGEIQEGPPAPDDGQPPIDDAPVVPRLMKSSLRELGRHEPR